MGGGAREVLPRDRRSPAAEPGAGKTGGVGGPGRRRPGVGVGAAPSSGGGVGGGGGEGWRCAHGTGAPEAAGGGGGGVRESARDGGRQRLGSIWEAGLTGTPEGVLDVRG